MPIWHLWIGRARHPGPGAASFAVEVFNVGGWLTHGDFVLNAEVDFLAVQGSRKDFMVGCRRAAAAVSRCLVSEDRWILPHLAVRAHFECSRWVYLGFHSRFSARLCGLPPGCLCLIRVVGLGLRRFRGFGVFMMIVCSS